MSTTQDLKNYTLLGAVIKNDISVARELLIEGANPNYPVKSWTNLIHFALKRKQIKMVKVLVEYGAELDDNFLEMVFQAKNHKFTKELVSCLVWFDSSVKFIQRLFDELLFNRCPDPLAVEIFLFLVDHGLPIDDLIHFDYQINSNSDDLCPLSMAIIYQMDSIVSLLVEYGANVNKKTINGRSPLYLAVLYDNDESMIKLLLNKGALVNERNLEGKTALHKACENRKPEIVQILLERGANINICDDNGDTPLKYANDYEVEKILAKEIERWLTDGEDIKISSENTELLRQNDRLLHRCKNCYLELEKMKDHKFYNGISMYDVLRAHPKKLTALTKNKDFVAAFESSWNRKLFEFYGEDLDDIFMEAVERRDVLQIEEEKLTSVFKNYLPDLVIRKISYFSSENLFV